MAKSKPQRDAIRRPKRKGPPRPAAGSTRKASESRASNEDGRHGSDEQLPAFAIVGIGASAGGLEALGQLLDALPPNPGVAIIIVQHLAPRHDSMLAHLLAEHTKMPVAEVTDKMLVERDHVYVVPPNREMNIAKGHLRLKPRPDNHTQYNPIDFFFRSLAEYAQNQAIGVILSGTASDGAMGLREIKDVGGIAIAQDLKTAKYDGMPRAAVATGVVDLVLPPVEIARELAHIGQQLLQAGVTFRTPQPQVGDADDDSTLPPHHLARVFLLLRRASGVDFTHYKLPTISRRLQRRMVLHKIPTLEKYVRYLEQNASEVTNLYQDILIHVTRFFRDAESFQALEKTVFPEIVPHSKSDTPIRIWVPGCSTGEEAYSVAIALLDYLGDDASGTPIQIFATDVSETAIEHARAGLYPESIAGDVSPARLRRFFSRVDGHYRINKNVRDVCIFARQDVTRDAPFSRLELIVCRNVMIYLGTLLQKRLMTVFHYALRPAGFLMLGSAETIGTHFDLFGIADKRHKIYAKKNATVSRVGAGFSAVDAATREPIAVRQSPDAGGPAGNVQNEANRVILARYSPPGVVVDSDLKIVQFRGQTGMYLEPAPGDASLSLLKMAREGLLYGLRTAIHEARKKGAVVRKEGLRVKVNGRIQEIDLEVIPLAATDGRHFLILFHDRIGRDGDMPPAQILENDKPPKKMKGSANKPDDDGRIVRLQQELAASREYLQSIIQDLEAANEELQSANEEILSSNEELQSTNEELDTAKEELQSTNEELNTVNDELQGRNEELSRVNSDLINLLGSVQIAIVMVAGDLRIRRLTPMAEKVLNLIPSDVGRRITDIKPNIDCPDLERLITEAIDTITIKECEVKDRQGNWYMLRIRPYKNVENRIDGAVLALFELDASHGKPRAKAEG